MIPGQINRQTGDINLAAALMACAIPLDRECPVRVIDSNGLKKPYASFRVGDRSSDGQHLTEKLNDHWSGTELLPEWHPFAHICDFIRNRPLPRMTRDEWLDYAVDHLCGIGINLPGLRTMDDVAPFVNALPRAIESYVLAFVANRALCLDLCSNAVRSIHMGRANTHAMIDSTLPKWQQNELLSIYQG